MYPFQDPYLRSKKGAYTRTSLSRIFPFNRQLRLSWSARSTCPRKYFRKLSAFSFQLSVVFTESWRLMAES